MPNFGAEWGNLAGPNNYRGFLVCGIGYLSVGSNGVELGSRYEKHIHRRVSIDHCVNLLFDTSLCDFRRLSLRFGLRFHKENTEWSPLRFVS